MAIGGVVINFAARTADAVRDIGKLTTSLDKTDDKAEKAGSTFKKKLAVGVAAVGAALVAAGGAMVDFAKSAAEDAAEAQTLANTLKTIPGVTQKMVDANADWVDSMQIATGVADSDLRRAVSKLALATGDLTRAQKLTAIAADTAAGSGKNLDSITQALAKAVNGNTTALQKNFPWLDKNKDGAVTLDEALQGLEGAYKGAAEAAADRKPWERFKIVMGELGEILGNKMLPYLDRLSSWLKDAKNRRAMEDFASDVAAVVDVVAAAVRAVWGLVNAMKSLWGWIDSVVKKWDAFLNSVDRAITWPWERGRRGGGGTFTAARPVGRASYASPPTGASSTTIIVQGSLNPQRTAQDLAGMLAGARVRTGYAGIRA